jgi:hypothetical protein
VRQVPPGLDRIIPTFCLPVRSYLGRRTRDRDQCVRRRYVGARERSPLTQRGWLRLAGLLVTGS